MTTNSRKSITHAEDNPQAAGSKPDTAEQHDNSGASAWHPEWHVGVTQRQPVRICF